MPDLDHVVSPLVASGRGILAADESIKTMSARLTAEGIEASKTTRRAYRQLLLTAPRLSDSVSGIILCDETFADSLTDGQPFPRACHDRGVLPGVKVDTGTFPLPQADGAKITEGLDGLGGRLADYAARGAVFAKWRAVIDVTNVSGYSLEANAHALARYAALCQDNGIVPIVEPEVLCTGSHELATCADVTTRTLAMVFDQLERHRVDVSAIVLKPNMVTPGIDAEQVPAETVAAATIDVLKSCVPHPVPGVAFLSGGHSNEVACDYLGAINDLATPAPWSLTYSFGRALVSDALRTWQGVDDQVDAAQQVLLKNSSRASGAIRHRAAPAGAAN